MPVYQLDRRPIFPPPEEAEPDGLLAVGGDLSAGRLLEAYRNGIFPWFEPGDLILWWSPDPRLVLFPQEIQISRSLRATIRKGKFEVRFDTAFRRVMQGCGAIKRKHEDGTWIGAEILRGYAALHDLGYAHSIESWSGGEVVGGLNGVCLGTTFFGESMFALQADASKVALVSLARQLVDRGIEIIDCQVPTDHLKSLGAREISREEFLAQLRRGLRSPIAPGPWTRSDP